MNGAGKELTRTLRGLPAVCRYPERRWSVVLEPEGHRTPFNLPEGAYEKDLSREIFSHTQQQEKGLGSNHFTCTLRAHAMEASPVSNTFAAFHGQARTTTLLPTPITSLADAARRISAEPAIARSSPGILQLGVSRRGARLLGHQPLEAKRPLTILELVLPASQPLG